MKISNEILKHEEVNVKLGDALIDREGFVYLVVADEQTSYQRGKGELDYRLLRLRDGDNSCRIENSVFENTLTRTTHKNANDFLDVGYKVIPKEQLKLILIGK